MEKKLNVLNILNSLPFMFEKNIGQHDKEAKFVLRQNECTTFFTNSEIVLALTKEKEIKDISELIPYNIEKHNKILEPREYEVDFLRISLENSNQEPEIIGEKEFKCKINYLIGSSKDEWITDIPIYEKVVYKEVYPGIDLAYYGNQGILEHDFIVSPGSNIKNIKMKFEGADNTELDEDGNILISIKGNKIQMLKPRVYQEIKGKQIDIQSEFIIEDNNQVSFKIESYDEDTALVIDPQVLYGTYLGGYYEDDYGHGIGADNKGNAYVTGYTRSYYGFPITGNAYQGTFTGGTYDSFLIKIDTNAATGPESLLYGSYIGGSNGDTNGYGVVADNNEYAYLTGRTYSTVGFPITSNAYQSTFQGGAFDAYLIKIDTRAATGPESLLYGTYLGGDGNEVGFGVAVDNNENAYIAGFTSSQNGFPITGNAYQGIHQGGTNDAFLIKIDTRSATGPASLLYGTYLGGNGDDIGRGVVLDISENAYISGLTSSTTAFPITPNAYQGAYQGGTYDAFLIKINTNAATGPASLLYGTYIGGAGDDEGTGVAVDTRENAYISGLTSSTTGFPITPNAYQGTYQGGTYDAFLIKIDTNAATGPVSLLYGTYIGGNNYDLAAGVVVDINENASIIGYTDSTTGFPITANAYLKTGSTSFITTLNTRSSTGPESLVYSSYLGPRYAFAVAIDNNNNVYITGEVTASDPFPLTPNAYQTGVYGITYAAYIIKLGIPLLYELILNKAGSKDYTDINTTLIYTINIFNNGSNTLNNINFIDTVPNNTVMIPNSLTLNGTTIPGNTNYPGITIPSIGLGATSTIQFSVSIGATIPSINYMTNTALAIYTSTINNTIYKFNSNTVTTTIVNANLNNTFKHADSQAATCGDTITYSISVYNSGNTTAQDVFIMDTIPNSISFISGSVVVNGTTLPGSNPFLGMTLPNIGAGVTSTVSFKVKIDC